MTTLHEQYADGDRLFVGTAGANTGVSGINDITTEVNRHTTLINNVSMQRSTIAFVSELTTTDTTAATVGSRFLTPTSGSYNILLGTKISTNLKNNTGGQSTDIRVKITPSDGYDYWMTCPVTNSTVQPFVTTNTSYVPVKKAFLLNYPGDLAGGAVSGAQWNALMGAGSYLVSFQMLVTAGTGTASGTYIDLFYLDAGASGARIS